MAKSFAVSQRSVDDQLLVESLTMKLQKYQTIHSDDELTFEPDDDGDVYMAADVDARIVELENLLQCFCDRSFSNNGNRCIQCGRWPGHGEVHADDCPVGKALSLMET